jgi:hypothetical protein
LKAAYILPYEDLERLILFPGFPTAVAALSMPGRRGDRRTSPIQALAELQVQIFKVDQRNNTILLN